MRLLNIHNRGAAIVTLFFFVLICRPVLGEEPVMPTQDEKIKIYDVQKGAYETVEKIEKTDAEWMKQLTKDQYKVLRQHGTEKPFCELPNKKLKNGIYRCAGCGTDLFQIDTKF